MKNLFAFVYNKITPTEACYSRTACYVWIEKGAFTPKASRWKVDGRQSSSVSVLLPTCGPQKGRSEAGIDSVAEFRGVMQQGHPRFETPRSAPLARGLGDGDFHF
jgi:hypothetical protein